jgi:hypothetical protein
MLAGPAGASTDATGAPPLGDVFYEADCTTSFQANVVAPYLIGLNINASPDGSAPTGASFGATGTVDFPLIGPVVAGGEASVLGGLTTMLGVSTNFIIGSTDGTATGTFAYTHTFAAVPVGSPGSAGRQITGVSWASGSTTLNGNFNALDIGYSVAAATGGLIDPTSVITGVVTGVSATISVPTLGAGAAATVGIGQTILFTDSTLSTGNVFTTNGSGGGVSNIGVTAVNSVTLNAAIPVTFGGPTGSGVGPANCLLTGWNSVGSAGPAQMGETEPALPVPPAAGSATALILASGGFISQPGTTQKITPPPAAHVTLTGGETTTTGAPTTTTAAPTTTTTVAPTTTTAAPTTTTTVAPTTTTAAPTTTTTVAPTTTTAAPTTTTTVAPTTTTTAGETTTTTAGETTTTTAPPRTCRPGFGFGDKNHCHTGPPGTTGTGGGDSSIRARLAGYVRPHTGAGVGLLAFAVGLGLFGIGLALPRRRRS